jgi:hypothetical protein
MLHLSRLYDDRGGTSPSAQLADAAGRGDGDASTARSFTFTFEVPGAPRSQ